MGETKISWTSTRLADGTVLPGFTFNPFLGCTKVSPACDNCYAQAWAKRAGHPELWEGSRRRTSPGNWRQPLKWNAKAKEAGVRRRVFCASLADVFDNQVPVGWREDLWTLIVATPQLDWLLLTKRPQNALEMLPANFDAETYPNIWVGTTAENQTEFDRRRKHLEKIPAKIRFLSCEPLLGEIKIGETCSGCGTTSDAHHIACEAVERPAILSVDWVIIGGESGANRREMNIAHLGGLVDVCRRNRVPIFVKQDSGRHPGYQGRIPPELWIQQFPENI